MRWMHLSDIHFGYANASVDTMRRKLLEKARTIEQVDCLFITGDLRYGKTSPLEYPQETLEFLVQLREALNLTPNDVYIVPGNHDVDRCQALTSVVEGLLKEYTTLDGDIDENTLEFISSRRAAFKKLYQEICGRNEPELHYCETRENYNIICLNTAVACGRDGEDGDLIIGSALLNRLSSMVDTSKPSIVLAHHDFDAFRLEERQKLEITLKELGATLYLCGHKHVAQYRQQNTFRTDKDLHVFLCGTNMDRSPGISQTDMDFFVGQSEDGRAGFVQAYKWYPRPCKWLSDNEFSSIQNEAIDGKIFFPKDLRPNAEKWFRQDVFDRYRQYIKVQCGEIELSGLPINEQEVSHRFALRRLFVPLRFSYNEMSLRTSQEVSEVDCLPAEPIPVNGTFKKVILSDPGGGKSTLLKWIASVYAFPEEYRDEQTFLPDRKLFPVWIRCRDIPEGSRPTIWGMIRDIAAQGEWLPNDSSYEDFTALVTKYLSEDKMLLLIDGLDEIGAEADRDHFVEQLGVFADLYPGANILVSSRPTGLPLVLKRKFTDFQYLNIAPLTPSNIKSLCLKWNQVVRGDSSEVRLEASALAERIIGNERILRLAINPMLLTTLLLVERRVGRLPTKRVELYEEAIQVLLETWNSRGHSRHHIDLDEARYQLAYVAYHMMTRKTDRKTQIARITRSELLKLLHNARHELAELISGSETPSQFVQNIEHRSALLIQKGYEENELGEREAVYEFQHLTFQEYLAAYALTHLCYPGATEQDDPIAMISTHLTNPNMREVIPLVAVRLPRFHPGKLVDNMLAQIDYPGTDLLGKTLIREILLQLVADELAIQPEKIDGIFKKCFVHYYFYNDCNVIQQILEGKYSERLYARFKEMDTEMNEGFDYHVSVLDVLSKKISNPKQHYLDHKEHEDVRVRANAISIISCPIAFEILSTFSLDSSEVVPFHKSQLFDSLDSRNPIIQHAALWGLQDCSYVDSPLDWSRYVSGFVRFINQSDRIYCVVDASCLPDLAIPLLKQVELSETGYRRIANAAETFSSSADFDYTRLVTLALIGIVACDSGQDISSLLSSLRRARNACVELDELYNEFAYEADRKLHRLLNIMVLNSECCETKKGAIREHILKTDLKWATQSLISQNFVPPYCDYSTEMPYFVSTDYYMSDSEEDEGSLNPVIDYIRSRFCEMGMNALVD